MKKLLYGLVVLLSGLWTADTAWAECRVLSDTPTYTAGQLKDLTCDTSGNLQTNAANTPATASASAPTNSEGASAALWVDLAGLLHVAVDLFNVLISGEDQPNHLLMTSGGAVRVTHLMTGVTTNTTSVADILPVGTKTIFGEIVGTGAQSVNITIYGDKDSSISTGVVLCIMTLSGTTTANTACNITANYLFYAAKTEVISGTGATVSVDAMY